MTTAEENHLKFIRSIRQNMSGPFHIVRQDGIFEDVMALHSKEDVMTEFPLCIKFAAVGLGGVCREMFAAFWEAYTVKMCVLFTLMSKTLIYMHVVLITSCDPICENPT